MYQLLEVSLADVGRLYDFKLQDVFGAEFSLKGFQYPWVLTSREWRTDEKVLDVGAAYSPLPVHIQKTHGCEVWAVDDFGLDSEESFWTRRRDPQEFIAEHPGVKYVQERLGDADRSSLPAGYFDVVYSASTLEHVPGDLVPKVWQHMDALLKPGGEMMHAIDVWFPSNLGLRGVLRAQALDYFYAFVPRRRRQELCWYTPKAYVRLVSRTLGSGIPVRDLSLLKMILDPGILTENYSIGFNRVAEGIAGYRFKRTGALLLRMTKLG